MSETLRIYKPYEIEFQKLQTFVNMVNKINEKDYNPQIKNHPKVTHILGLEDLYFDAGQCWMYTAVTDTNLNEPENSVLRTCHALCPRDYEFIINCDNFRILFAFANKYVEHIHNPEIKTPLCKNL